jgi:hypothetical protein
MAGVSTKQASLGCGASHFETGLSVAESGGSEVPRPQTNIGMSGGEVTSVRFGPLSSALTTAQVTAIGKRCHLDLARPV